MKQQTNHFFRHHPSQVQGEWQRAVGVQGNQPGNFKYPLGLALNPDEGFLLVVDSGNARVAVLRALDCTWVRQLTGPPGTLESAVCVAVVPSTGEVLVSVLYHSQVVRFRSIDDDTLVGTLGTGRGSGPTEFWCPRGLAVLDVPHCTTVCFSLSFVMIIFFYIPFVLFLILMSPCRRVPWSWWPMCSTIG